MTVTSRPQVVPASGESWTPLRHVGALDGLRAVAVVAVTLFHGGWFDMDGGFVGVDLFFVLSGFLITRLLIDEQVGRGRISLRAFYIRRALRLLPPLVAMVAVVSAVALVADAPLLEDRLGPRTFWALSFLANWHDVVTGTHGGPFSHLWSLSVEEQFYVVWPIVVVGVVRRWGTAAVAQVSGLLALVAAAATIRGRASGTPGFDLYFGTHSHGAILLLAGAWLGASPALLDRLPARWARRLGVFGLIGLGLLACSPDRFSVIRLDRFALIHAGLGYGPIVGVSLVLVASAVVQPDWGPMAWRPLQEIGRRSYGIYLWHIPMFWIGPVVAPTLDPRITVIGGALVAAWVSHALVEAPAARLRRRWC